MVAPEVPSFSGQTNTICQTFVCVCFGDKGKGTRCYLKVMKYLCKMVAILILVYLFVNIQMNLFKYLYVVMPHSSRDNLALSSKPNTTKN